jgi:hypothetical protein
MKHGQRESKYDTLICSGAKLGECDYKSINYSEFEQCIQETLLNGPDLASVMNQEHDDTSNNTLNILEGKLAEVEKQVSKLATLLLADETPSPTAYQLLKSAELTKAELQKQLQTEAIRIKGKTEFTYSDYGRLTTDIRDNLQEPEYRRRIRDALRQVVTKIVVDRVNRTFQLHFTGAPYPVEYSIDEISGIIRERKGTPQSQATAATQPASPVAASKESPS